MKGKRQIITGPISFDNNDSQNTFPLGAQTETRTLQGVTQQGSSIIKQESNDQDKDQQKKKRLEMLKQKYLKKAQKEEQTKKDIKKDTNTMEPNHENIKQEKKQEEKTNEKAEKIKEPKKQAIQVTETKTEKVEQQKATTEIKIIENLQQKQQSQQLDEKSLKKSEQQVKDHKTSQVPIQNKPRIPPKHPIRKPPPKIYTELPIQKQLNEQVVRNQAKLPDRVDMNQQQQQIVQSLEQRKQSLNENIEYSLQNWLNCQKNGQEGNDSFDFKASLEDFQQATNGLLKFFVLQKSVTLSEVQKKYLYDTFVHKSMSSGLSEQQLVIPLLSLIKIGDHYMQKHIEAANTSALLNFIKILSNIPIQSFLSPGEINQFLKSYLNKMSNNLNWHRIIQAELLTPKMIGSMMRDQIYSLIGNLSAPEKEDCLEGLTKIKEKNRISESYKLYCLFLNRLTDILIAQNSQQINFEAILKQLGEIQTNEAYQFKKQLKLKIIKVMDKNDPSPIRKTKSEQPSDSKTIKYAEKNEGNKDDDHLGKNLMGFFNNAYQKIKSTVPEKKQSILEKEEKIQFDSVRKIWLCNGQPIQAAPDETEQQTQEKKKKAPPPPPSKFPKPAKIPPKVIKSDAFEQQDQEISNKKNGEEEDIKNEEESHAEVKVMKKPVPPPRIGGRGKPRVNVRYA